MESIKKSANQELYSSGGDPDHSSSDELHQKSLSQTGIAATQDDINGNNLRANEDVKDEQVAHSKSTELPPAPLYPRLSRDLSDFAKDVGEDQLHYDDEDVPRMATSFTSLESPDSISSRDASAVVGKARDDDNARMHKFTLYETTTYFYIVGSDLLDSTFRILKIDRTAEPGKLSISEDDTIYTKKEMHQILNAVDEGNRSTAGLKLTVSFWGLLGFIRFTGPYYMVVVTKRNQVALIGGHYVFQVDGTEMIPIAPPTYGRSRPDRNPDETRYVSILNSLDMTKSFYFSRSYDVTRTLQFNIMREREALKQSHAQPRCDHNDMFVWNHHLLTVAKEVLKATSDWCLSIIHGYVDQAALSIYWGRVIYVTIIARRSRFFAGARYLKRGANDLGYVANDVETEQIISEMLTTSFHAPGPVLFANPHHTSYVQHRGSIPLYWTQDPSGVSPKPDISLNVIDPFFTAPALHFDNLFQRYGTPIYALNLVKARERTPRESKLLNEYTNAITYLNQFLPEDKQIIHHAWDMSRASKSRDQDVIGSLEGIAEDILPRTSFFQNGNDTESGLKLQSGVARTNCVDCLDRTNAAQFVIAKKALGYQLQALGVIESANVEYDSDAINLFTHMWHDHGDTIAVQYGGSHLVNTMSTYRKINQWTSQSRDMVESFKRYYNNSFMDAQRQEAYNLFLGNFVCEQNKPMLWEMSSDYYLHHAEPRSVFGRRRPSYRQWYTQSHLEAASIPPAIWPQEFVRQPLRFFDDYWTEYYRPLAVSSFKKIFSFKMHSNLRYISHRSVQEGKYDLSPFRVRSATSDTQADNEKKSLASQDRKGVKIVTPADAKSGPESLISSRLANSAPTDPLRKPSALGPWLDSQVQHHANNRLYTGIIRDPSFEVSPSANPAIPPLPPSNSNTPSAPPTKDDLALEAFTKLISNTLNPSVSHSQLTEYEFYVSHPSNMPLVVSSTVPADLTKIPRDYLEYLSKTDDSLFQQVDSNQSLLDSERGGLGMNLLMTMNERAEQDREDYEDFLAVPTKHLPEGLTVLEEDLLEKKRYKRYRQWVKGKSLFKQKLVVGGEIV